MVKSYLLLIATFLSFQLSFAQLIQLGVGAEGNLNTVWTNDVKSKALTRDSDGEELEFTHEQVNIPFSFKIPIFLRYKMANGLWLQLDYATENLTIKSTGSLNYTPDWIHESTIQYMSNDLWTDFNSNYNTFNIDSNQFMSDYYEVAFEKEKNYWENSFAYKQTISLNNLSFKLGYTFLRTKKIRPFLAFDFTWANRRHKYSLQSLQLEGGRFDKNMYNYIKEMPQINEHLFFTGLNFGVEIHKMRFGLTGRITVNSLEKQNYKEERESNQTVLNRMYSFGAFMNFSLFDFNLYSKGDRQKLKEDELKVMGNFVETKKKLNLSIGLDIPLYSNLSNFYEQNTPSSAPLSWGASNGDDWDINENVWIMRQSAVLEPNVVNTGFEDNEYFEILALGEIKMIRQFPSLSFNLEFEPVQWFSWETKLGYQYNEFHTSGRFISQKRTWYQDYQVDTMTMDTNYYLYFYGTESMAPITLNQSFHNFSLGQRFNFKFSVVPGFKIGFSGGAKVNFFLPGKFKVEANEYNDIQLIAEFEDYWTKGKGNYGDKWKDVSNFGGSSEEFNFFYFKENDIRFDQDGFLDFEQSFTNVGDDARMSKIQNKINFTWMAGIDFYFERLRFNIYSEGAITDINFLYRDYFSVGLGVHYYLRK